MTICVRKVNYMSKLCKLVKDDYLKDNIDHYMEMVKKPIYICKKCGRVANDEDKLCKAKKIK